MLKKEPEGYRKLLAYQKACELQVFTNDFVTHLPKTKTFFDLADQMARSGRSGSKNIVEGWKRNTTKEYFDFLGFSIGAVEELKDDAADIATGVYPGLFKEIMGEKEGRGEMGNPLHPLAPLFPLPITRAELDKIKFYPLNQTFPPVVQLFLRAKEVNFLLYKLQQSLDVKMDKEHSKPLSQKARERFSAEQKAGNVIESYLKEIGLIRLPNGQYVENIIENLEKREEGGG